MALNSLHHICPIYINHQKVMQMKIIARLNHKIVINSQMMIHYVSKLIHEMNMTLPKAIKACVKDFWIDACLCWKTF